MKPSFLNLFKKKFTRGRVVPTISANVSWDNLGSTWSASSSFPYHSCLPPNGGRTVMPEVLDGPIVNRNYQNYHHVIHGGVADTASPVHKNDLGQDFRHSHCGCLKRRP